MQDQELHQWIPCRIYPGMFSDERAVEVGDRSYFVSQNDVKGASRVDGAAGQLRVKRVQIHGQPWVELPTTEVDTVPYEG